MKGQVRVRFAPSPTGALHVGSARTALFNWLFARHHQGTFILRIEDTDTGRSTDESAATIFDGLQWLGLDWDEGPEKGGAVGPYVQSERTHLYREFAERLLTKGLAYPCYCTVEELTQRREALKEAGLDPKYDRKCYHLSEDERRRLEDEGRRPVLRFYSSDEGETIVDDLIGGEFRFSNQLLDDFVIMRSDGLPTYNFAVVVDDHLMDITHVIRGDDHISNTPRQIQVYEALGLKTPRFAHLPMIHGADRTKLSKRHGARSVMEYARDGYLSEAFINYLALLGWAYDDSQEIFDIPAELIQKFSLDKISKNPAIFDHEKFEWMNGVHIRKLTAEQLAARVRPILHKADLVHDTMSAEEEERLINIIRSVQVRLTTLNDVVPMTRYFFANEIEFDEKAVNKWLRQDYVPELFEQLIEQFEQLDPFDEERIESLFDGVGEQFQLGRAKLMQPVRVAVTGSTVSPSMYETLALLGKELTCQRLGAAMDLVRG